MNWRENKPGEEPQVEVGDTYLVAVEVGNAGWQKSWWEYAIISATETGWELEGDVWGWDWSDVTYWMPASELAPRKAEFSPRTAWVSP